MSVDQRIREGLHLTSTQFPEPDTRLALHRVTNRGRAATRRRGLIAGGLAAAAAAAVVVVAVSVTSGDGAREAPPLDNPSPTETDSTSEQWTPERIRAEGSPGDAIPTSESGLTARSYVVCDGSRCEGDSGPPEDMHSALEVTQEGRSALFDLHHSSQPWVRVFDEDSVLVQDREYGDDDGPVRYRLLQADGTAVQLQLLDDPAPTQPGPGVFVIDDFLGWNAGMNGVEEVYFVDDRAGTLQPLDVPEEVRYWAPNLDEFLWGVTDDCRVFWATTGTLEHRRLDCQDSMHFTWMDDDWFPADWLRPGRMVAAEQLDDRMILHVSLDRGATWQRIPDKDDSEVSDVLRQVG